MLLILGIAFAISGATGLSMSSVTTNIRIGPGGAYSVISRSLGLEVGGSIGIPLYLAQALVVALYVFAFREGWQVLFPAHPALAVDLAVFALVLAIAAVSAKFSFRVQYVVLALIVAAFVSVAAGAFAGPFDEPIRLWGRFPELPRRGSPASGSGACSRSSSPPSPGSWPEPTCRASCTTAAQHPTRHDGGHRDQPRRLPVARLLA